MIQVPEEFKVTEATPVESYEILSEPQLIKHLPIQGIYQLPDYIRTHRYILHLASFGKHDLLFFFFEHARLDDVYEIHIACPRNSIRASRVLATLAAKWIASKGTIGAKALITKCPKGKISNMCTKLGGKIIYRHENTEDVSILFDTSTLHY